MTKRHLEEKFDDMKKRLQGNEEKLAVYERRSGSIVVPQNTDESISREQQLEAEVAELRCVFLLPCCFVLTRSYFTDPRLRLLRSSLRMQKNMSNNIRTSQKQMRRHYQTSATRLTNIRLQLRLRLPAMRLFQALMFMIIVNLRLDRKEITGR